MAFDYLYSDIYNPQTILEKNLPRVSFFGILNLKEICVFTKYVSVTYSQFIAVDSLCQISCHCQEKKKKNK